ncbi:MULTISPECIES: MaoC/PaaZ C-terminal domain-containing protein [Dietzia]|uniref:Acyl dehydratase n=1 Tax=Dietzia cinnamea TaxID=321318 RepID=A0A4R3ZUK9_9ACTN|nr:MULTISPECIES: MaoC/PaaZ C-terminal domain-containing protein [Dietzia]KZO59132.1 3-alpha,7-alpha,12-alpha-trihydroxy-5-beta-cholest-24-enoyl-CoA hydratase [Dietzia maris]MBM7229264.1 MaoC family dehydratase N-terminal domain-containing protein [Dietzia cinnamea]MCT2057929.1 MaoC family dehydratase N-terminal domain-containing protein [Dietzia cinnamea]MCT2097034.1 MaoC family dehydratase N-terminal domain-containing protein [Dietzia cinnamea]MCT2120389.1 MaoC family dehydratase N-terminal d
MPIDLDTALGAQLPSQEFSWTASDVALYALSVGAAADPTDTTGLEYVHDSAPKVLPSFATVAATMNVTEAPKVSFPGVEIDLAKVVHGSQSVTLHRPIPAAGTAVTTTKIAEIQDKGSAAVIIQESETVSADGEKLWTSRSGIFAKGEGGFGGERGTSEKVEYPERDADHTIEVATLPQQALFYRLCGDRNPLHSDPAFAEAAGFPRPILHGLCSYGVVLRAVVDEVLGGDVSRVSGYGVTFGGIFFPGETMRVRVWEEGSRLLVAATVAERDDAPVLKNVVVELA